MRFDRRIFSIGLLIAAIAWTLWFVFAGFGNHQDPLYWLYKYEHMEGGWMAVGTLLTGGAVVRLFGAQLLPLRLAGWLCTAAAIALPYCVMLNKDQRRNNFHWLAMAYLLMGYGAFQEFSPGTLSVLLLSALWVTQSPVVAGLAIAARFPNILALLVLVPLWKKRSLWNIPIAAATAGAVYALGCIFATPAAVDAAMTSHEIGAMIAKLWHSGGLLIGYILLAIGAIKITDWEPKPGDRKWQALLGLAVGLAITYYIATAIKPTQWYNTNLTYLLSALCIVIALTVYRTPSHPTGNPSLVTGIALLAVATLGTDTAWLKLFPAMLCLLPVAGAMHADGKRESLWWMLLPVALIVMHRHCTNSIGRTDLTKVETVSAIPPYKGIAITRSEEELLTKYKNDYDSLINAQMVNDQMVNILAVGQENHLIRAVTGCGAARYNEFWSNIYDSVYTAKYRTLIAAEKPTVFCSFSPQFKTKPGYQDTRSAMEKMLLEEGYTVKDRSEWKYMIYTYDKEIR